MMQDNIVTEKNKNKNTLITDDKVLYIILNLNH